MTPDHPEFTEYVAAAPELEAAAQRSAPVDLVWSDDNERFDHETLEELLDSSDLQVGDTVYFGEPFRAGIDHFFDVDHLLNGVGERAYEDYGECAEDYPSVSDEAKAELQGFLTDWARRHCAPCFWRVENVRSRVLTAADFDEGATP